jgi:UPF0271 protein
MAARDASMAAAVARAVLAFDRSLMVFGPAGSELVTAARAAGLRPVAEAFADRAYQADGSLLPRGTSGAVVTDGRIVVARALRMVRERTVVAADGTIVPLEAETLSVHSDTPGADRLAADLRAGLEAAGVSVCAVSR